MRNSVIICYAIIIEDVLNTLISDVQKFYENSFDSRNIAFPIKASDLNDILDDVIQKYNFYENNIDELSVSYFEKELRALIEKITKPLVRIDIDIIFKIFFDDEIYRQFEFDLFDPFLKPLYISITKQPQIFYLENEKINLWTYNNKINSSHSEEYFWIEHNASYIFNYQEDEYKKQLKKPIKKNLDVTSKVYKGNQYELLCKEWLQENLGCKSVEVVGKTGVKGIDTIAEVTNNKFVGIQCKYKVQGKIDSPTVRILNSSKEYQKYKDIDNFMIMSNVLPTKEAVQDMKLFNITFLMLQ